MRWLQPAATLGPPRLLLFGPLYCREASHRPLHGTPADAPFHFPDPELPLSWPFAYAPPIETRTSPSRPMLPVTSAPAAETLPSVTVSVERLDGSQEPALVTIVTLQSPSYGVWAVAGTAARAAAVRAEARNRVRMRLWRMNQIPDLRDDPAYSATMCSKFAAPRQHD